MRVLVLEDNWPLAQAMKLLFEAEGMEVRGPVATITAARGLAAERPDWAVVDINLKGELAYDLIDELHAQGVRIVVVSGYSVLPAAMGKVVAALRKPLDGPALLETMRRAHSS